MKTTTTYLLATALLFLFACGSDDDNGDMTPDPDTPIVTSHVLETVDGIDISATLAKPANLSAPAPAVIFIHGNNTTGQQEWTNNALFGQLVNDGYIALAYDVRLFGDSGADGGTQADLFNNPDRAPRDLDAVVAFLQADADVDNSRIGAIGSKLGAEIALVGLVQEDLQTVVGFSVLMAGYSALSANVDNPQLQSVFYIVSENEINGAAATDAQSLLDQTSDPKKLVVVPDSDETGSAILTDDATLADQIITWIDDNL